MNKYKESLKKFVNSLPFAKYVILRVARHIIKIEKTIGVLPWIFSVSLLPHRENHTDHRLLLIYDLSSQPFNIGDFIILQEVSLTLCKKYNLESADIAIVYEPQQPALAIPVFSSITEDNVLYHLASILPVAQINQNLGSIFIFNSHLQLERYITENRQYYHVWPSAIPYKRKDYLYYAALNEVLHDYFKEHGNIPLLHCRRFLIEWAAEFYRKNLDSCIPVTVNLRNNKLFAENRNSSIDCWLDFFKYCRNRYPLKFIVICAFHEIDKRMRNLDNVIIAKDFHTGIEQDLALIGTSAIHMGAPSGPFSMAWFGDKPYLMFNWCADPKEYKGLIQDKGSYRFIFSIPSQLMIRERETTELLISEFSTLWDSLDHSKFKTIEDSPSAIQKDALTWLR